MDCDHINSVSIDLHEDEKGIDVQYECQDCDEIFWVYVT